MSSNRPLRMRKTRSLSPTKIRRNIKNHLPFVLAFFRDWRPVFRKERAGTCVEESWVAYLLREKARFEPANRKTQCMAGRGWDPLRLAIIEHSSSPSRIASPARGGQAKNAFP